MHRLAIPGSACLSDDGDVSVTEQSLCTVPDFALGASPRVLAPVMTTASPQVPPESRS